MNISFSEYDNPEVLMAVAQFATTLSALRSVEIAAQKAANREDPPVPVQPAEVPAIQLYAEPATNPAPEVPAVPTTLGDVAPEVPAVPEVQATVAPTGDRDTAGHFWDTRIHAGTKTKNGDGSWKLRRGVDKDLVAEIRASAYGTTPALDQLPTPADLAAAVNPAVFNTPPTAAADPAVFNTPPAAAAPVDQVPGELDWPTVLATVVDAKHSGRYDEVNSAAFFAANSIAELAMLNQRPDLFAAFLHTTVAPAA